MTIGIAAAGVGAGLAIVQALRAVESIGQGAVGGFVSLAAISDGRIERLETQQGGAQALLADDPPAWLRASHCAVLISSGPNRPAPLAQFTPGDAAVGLLTGHRFPNAPDHTGTPLNLSALELMRRGEHPQHAVDRVANQNPTADAGLIAIAPDGRIGLRDFDYLDQFTDRGHATLSASAGSVAVLHNAIMPYRGLALVAAEVALDALGLPMQTTPHLELRVGLPLRVGPRNAVEVDPAGAVVGLVVSDLKLLTGTHTFGLGYHPPILGTPGKSWLRYEPFLVSKNGVLQSVDGQAHLSVAMECKRQDD